MSAGGGSWAEALDEVAALADAVLFEGYLLYPYRASAQKNRLRWQWGVLTPEGFGTENNEPSSSRTECLLEPRPGAELHVRVRFLQVQDRTVLDAAGREVDELTVGDARHLRFEEGIPRQVDFTVAVSDLAVGVTVPIRMPASESTEEIVDGAGAGSGRLVRRCRPLTGRIVLGTTELPGPYGALRLRLDVHNDAEPSAGVPREEALRTSLIGTHSVLAVSAGAFLSLTDPPEWARPAAAECVNTGSWPVLAGPPERVDLLLASPIILSDHPQLAPESTINLFDGTENDEILTLRTMVLTDAEKAEARATDPRAAAVIDAVDALPPEILERLHGAIRSMGPAAPGPTIISGAGFGADSPAEQPPDRVPWWDPAADASVDPETDSVLVGGVPVAKGSAVVLRPGPGGDAQDLFLAGMRATVQAVVHDVDGGVHVAVSVADADSPDADLEADLQLAHGRFRYFRPDELEVAP
ncbi:hypothetical protein [Pseudonocardia acidicola]|uniref:Uncharacterized protein n=1 Tax=Pseudonocardia acidicola TaxID=2724939 RepID=A0ABX1S6L9_9PSEU|nr:hypothetical protein [Pseudonocardia acidicola]NMH97206.1 hypothetical protein [Pseudonocardia acidicola]